MRAAMAREEEYMRERGGQRALISASSGKPRRQKPQRADACCRRDDDMHAIQKPAWHLNRRHSVTMQTKEFSFWPAYHWQVIFRARSGYEYLRFEPVAHLSGRGRMIFS